MDKWTKDAMVDEIVRFVVWIRFLKIVFNELIIKYVVRFDVVEEFPKGESPKNMSPRHIDNSLFMGTY